MHPFSQTKVFTTRQEPTRAFVSLLSHLESESVVRNLLVEHHKFGETDAKGAAAMIAAHVRQGLRYREDAQKVSPAVRPVLRYYALLNLAMAVVLVRRPPNYDRRLFRHGISLQLRPQASLALEAEAVVVDDGIIPAFSYLFLGYDLPPRTYRLKELCVPIPWISAELESLFNIPLDVVSVDAQHWYAPEDRNRTCVKLSVDVTHLAKDIKRPSDAPSRLLAALPLIKNGFPTSSPSASGSLCSRHTWSAGQRDDRNLLDQTIAQICNVCGHSTEVIDGDLVRFRYKWILCDGCEVLPTLPAALMLAYVLASVSRYRPLVQDQVDKSELSVLFRVFEDECDSYVLPAFRNLLYGNTVVIRQSDAT